MRVLPNFDSRIVSTRVGPVDVGAVEPDRFSDPQAGGGQQPDQRLVRGRWHRRQLPGLGHQRLDVAGAVDERRPPAAAAGDQPWRRHLGAGIDAGQVAGEAAGDRHPARRDAGGRVDAGSLRPGQRRGDGDGGQALGLQERHQPGQLAMVFGQVVAQAVAQPQVVAGRVGQGAHRAAPGQGWATVRKVAKSTLA